MATKKTIHEHRDGIRAAEYQVACCEDHYSDNPDAARLRDKWTRILVERRRAFQDAWRDPFDPTDPRD